MIFFKKTDVYTKAIPTQLHPLKCMFFLSTGRAGTTTISKALAKIPTVHSVHQPPPYFYKSRYHIYQEMRFNAAWIAEDFLEQRSPILEKTLRERRNYVESSAFLSFHTPVIAGLLPNSKFVMMYREPLDFVISGLRRGWYATHPNDVYRLVPRKDSEDWIRWKDWSRLERICWLWSAFNQTCLTCFSNLPESRRILMRSEDLWSNPIESAKKIIEFSGFSPDYVQCVAEELLFPHNKQKTTGENEILGVSEQEREIIHSMCGSTLAQLNGIFETQYSR